MPSELQDHRETVQIALEALASAYRGDWSTFDGRTLRDQLEELADALGPTTMPFELDRWYVRNEICPDRLSWAEHCGAERPEGIGPYWCVHLESLSKMIHKRDVREASGDR